MFSKLSLAAFSGNAHNFICDDVNDNKYSKDIHCKIDLLPFSQMYLHICINTLYELCEYNQQCIDLITESFFDGYDSTIWEDSHHVNQIKPYSCKDLYRIVKKVAPVKACVVPLIYSSNKNRPEAIKEKFSVISSIIDESCLGSLIFDDFYDWKEDFQNKRFTLPVTLALKELGVDDINQLDSVLLKELEKKVFLSKVPLKIFDIFMKKSIVALEMTKDAFPSTNFIISVFHRVMEKRILGYVNSLREICDD